MRFPPLHVLGDSVQVDSIQPGLPAHSRPRGEDERSRDVVRIETKRPGLSGRRLRVRVRQQLVLDTRLVEDCRNILLGHSLLLAGMISECGRSGGSRCPASLPKRLRRTAAGAERDTSTAVSGSVRRPRGLPGGGARTVRTQ